MKKDSSQELTLSGLSAIIDERDRRYDVIFASQKDSLNVAVDAINKQTEAAFRTAQTAIDKLELSQKVYNEDHNNLTKKMVLVERYDSDQKNINAKIDANQRNIEEKIDDVKSSIGKIEVVLGVGTGKEVRSASDQARQQWVILASIAAISVVSNIVMFLIVRGAP